MKITKDILTRIEGEATLEVSWKEGKIDFAKIKFMNFRGIENILAGRPILDSLAITPRVCGICNTSHTIATVNAIEDLYKNVGFPLHVSQKALKIREFVLNMEKIQNHIKWFIFSIYAEHIQKDSNALNGTLWRKAQKACAKSLQAAAIFSGQWPHGSFCMPGGVTCDPVAGDIQQALGILLEVEEYCENELFGIDLETYLQISKISDLLRLESIIAETITNIIQTDRQNMGQSYDQFISFGNSADEDNKSLKCNATKVLSCKMRYVNESQKNTFFESQEGYTYSKSALYKEDYYETGPIARLMSTKDPLTKDAHRKYKDSVVTRICARVSEIAHLIQRSFEILNSIDISQPSYIKPAIDTKELSGSGIGFCEAARGSLIHSLFAKEGKIAYYDIITPTVWNLGNGDRQNPSVAQKAIMGLKSMEDATFVFRTFDVCAVCTTQ